MSLIEQLVEEIEDICLEPEMVKCMLKKLNPKKHREFYDEYKELLKKFKKRCIKNELHNILEALGFERTHDNSMPNEGDLLAIIHKKYDVREGESIIIGQWSKYPFQGLTKCNEDDCERLMFIMDNQPEFFNRDLVWDIDIYKSTIELELIKGRWYYGPDGYPKVIFKLYHRIKK